MGGSSWLRVPTCGIRARPPGTQVLGLWGLILHRVWQLAGGATSICSADWVHTWPCLLLSPLPMFALSWGLLEGPQGSRPAPSCPSSERDAWAICQCDHILGQCMSFNAAQGCPIDLCQNLTSSVHQASVREAVPWGFVTRLDHMQLWELAQRSLGDSSSLVLELEVCRAESWKEDGCEVGSIKGSLHATCRSWNPFWVLHSLLLLP